MRTLESPSLEQHHSIAAAHSAHWVVQQWNHNHVQRAGAIVTQLAQACSNWRSKLSQPHTTTGSSGVGGVREAENVVTVVRSLENLGVMGFCVTEILHGYSIRAENLTCLFFRNLIPLYNNQRN